MAKKFTELRAKMSPAAQARAAALAQLLLASLDEDAKVEQAWAVEVERRISEIESGAATLIPVEVGLARVRAALK